MTDPNVVQLYSVDYVQMLQRTCREQSQRIEELSSCTGKSWELDNNLGIVEPGMAGHCRHCHLQWCIDRIADLEAATRRVAEALQAMTCMHECCADNPHIKYNKVVLSDPVIVALRRW
jgi:hypothetical protein